MTSRSLFSKLMKQDLKQRLWVLILSSIVFFVTMPIICTMRLQTTLNVYSEKEEYFNEFTGMWETVVTDKLTRAQAEFQSWFCRVNGLLILVAIVGAVICGISGFAYLHSRTKVDMYHSIPVKRQTHFAVIFTNGVLMYLIPYIAFMLVSILIASFYGIINLRVIGFCFYGCLINLYFFMCVYAAAILATVLTGNLMVAALGFIAICLYVPGVITIFEIYTRSYLTSLSKGLMNSKIIDVLEYLSPAGVCEKVASAAFDFATGTMTDYVLGVVIQLLIATVLIGAAIFASVLLYKNRGSEKAGTAMAFKITEPAARIMITVPACLLLTIMIKEVGLFSSLPQGLALFWLIVFAVIGAVLTHGFMETIYNRDVRKALRHFDQLLLSIVVALIIMLGFFFDVFKLDQQIPEQKEIEAMSVYLDYSAIYGSYYDETLQPLNETDFVLDNLFLSTEEAYPFAEYINNEYCNLRKNYILAGYHWENNYDKDTDTYTSYISAVGEDGKEYIGNDRRDVSVRYYMKNGSVIDRSYDMIVTDELLQRIAPIMTSEAYKKTIFPVEKYKDMGINVVSLVVDCYEAGENWEPWVTQQYWDYSYENVDGFLDVFYDEMDELVMGSNRYDELVGSVLLTFDISEYAEKHPDGVLGGYNGYYNSRSRFNLSITKNMPKTIEWLQTHGTRLPEEYDAYSSDMYMTPEGTYYIK